MAVVEPQRRGAAHVHVVYRGLLLPQHWLSQAATAAGFGRIVRVAANVDAGVAEYLYKSLSAELRNPALAPPSYFHRVRFSRDWGDLVAKRSARRWTAWHIVAARPGMAAMSAIARGYEVVDLVGAGPPHGSVSNRLVAWYRDLRSYLVDRARAASARTLA